jgi:beta-glucosidase/6-phospho-beta-glucosidase/beta-galactosidase
MPAQKGFLEIIKEKYTDGNYVGDQYGGAAGATGNGLPNGKANNFLFATGIECSYPTIDNGKTRRDLLEECDHYNRYKEDLGLVKEMGLKVLRYPELPLHFASYAGEVAKRYPWVRMYTPINEIYVTARASAKDGLWNEQLKDDKSFVTAIKHIVAASIMATHCIAEQRPNCMIIQSESAEYVHETKVIQSPEIKLTNQQRFLSFDLLYAVPPDADMLLYLMDNGMTREEYKWFMAGEPPGYQIMGNDYYGRNERILMPNGKFTVAEDVMGWYQITREYYDRYKKPVMHTETNTFVAEQGPNWLWKQWINILRMRREGVPVMGFTWYSLIDQIDWDISLAEKKGTINECGLYDLDRKPRLVQEAYKALLEEYGQISILPHGEMLEISDEDASLKTAV